MEVNESYVQFLLQLLNNEDITNIDIPEEELIINSYITLLSLSNLEFSEVIEQKEKEKIDDFLRKFNNLKVKIQLKRKQEEINKLAEELIKQYYENANVLSIYIPNGIEFENIINTMDAKTLTNLIDKVTKDKMNKEYSKEEINKKRKILDNLLPSSSYYIENNKIYIKNNEQYEEISLSDFILIYSYLLNTDNYNRVYTNNSSKINHDLVIANIIKLIVTNNKKQEINKSIIPLILTYLLTLDISNDLDIDTSEFHIENIKITELYSLASQYQDNGQKTSKWRNISIPNNYLISKIKEMVQHGMYYYQEDSFVLENIENKTSDFKISIKIDKIKELITSILENKLTKSKANNSKKNKK